MKNRPAPAGPRLFLDSADPADWARLLPLGLFHGLTTNPLLLERAGQPCTLANLAHLADQARHLGAREIHLQTWGETAEDMVGIGAELAGLARPGFDVAVKVPATPEGFRAGRLLRDKGARLTITAVYHPAQVLAAAAAGAAYAAPYLGRLEDAGRDGRELVLTMAAILEGGDSATRLLVASLRRADQVIDLAARGLDTFTFGPAVVDELLSEPLTDAAAADFQRAARAMGSGETA